MLNVPSFADLNLGVALPVIFLGLFTMVLLLVDLFIPRERKHVTAMIALGALVVAFVLNLLVFDSVEVALADMFIADRFTGFVNLVVLVAGVLTVLISVDYLKRAGIDQGEYYTLLLLSITGIMLMGAANDLIVIFVALELLSIPLYVMAAMRLNDLKSEESGIKYFILGAFASAFLVYGMAMIYGATGTTNLPGIFAAVDGIVAEASTSRLYLLLGAALVVVGLGFKVAAVPFHMWTPDVYEGAPTPVTAFMSVGAKAGGFAALLRVMTLALPAFVVEAGDTVTAWQTTVAIVAALTMLLGNVVAISQSNIKRMLAYSSIAHAGYILMAVAAAGTLGIAPASIEGAMVYLLAYTFTNLGAFAVAIAIEKDDGTGTGLEDFVGLGRSKPLLAAMMAVFMFSLTGIPLTAGFIGKWLIFSATIQAGLYWLAIIGVLTSVVSAYYYVRVIINMYLRDGEGSPAEGSTPLLNGAVYAAFAATLLLGIFPILATNLLDGARVAFALIF